MRAGKFMGSALVAGLMLVGCGGPQVEEADARELASREDDIPACQGESYEFEYYSDASLMTMVGSRGCSCGVWARWGRVTEFVVSYTYSCVAP